MYVFSSCDVPESPRVNMQFTVDSLLYARDAFHRLASVSAGNSPVCAYTLNAKDQRTSSSLANGSSWAYGYDSRSQLASAVKSLPGVPDESFGYLYDDIGNRTSSTEGGVTRAYTANNLNQYTAITNPAVSPAHDGFEIELVEYKEGKVIRRIADLTTLGATHEQILKFKQTSTNMVLP